MGIETTSAKKADTKEALGGGIPSAGINLTKGEKINLSKDNPGLTKVLCGLGWDINAGTGAAFDLDASVLLLDASGKVRTKKDFIFFNNLKSDCGSVCHLGDNLTGAGDGDDEQVKVNLSTVPVDVDKIVFMVNIYQAASRGQNFGQVRNAFIRLVDDSTGVEIAKYDLSEDYSSAISVIMGELYRHNGDWKFNAMGQGRTEDLSALCSIYGL